MWASHTLQDVDYELIKLFVQLVPDLLYMTGP